jgi:hypothetical protein
MCCILARLAAHFAVLWRAPGRTSCDRRCLLHSSSGRTPTEDMLVSNVDTGLHTKHTGDLDGQWLSKGFAQAQLCSLIAAHSW